MEIKKSINQLIHKAVELLHEMFGNEE